MSPQAGERAAERKAEWNEPRAGRDQGARASRFTELQRPPRSDRARGRPGAGDGEMGKLRMVALITGITGQ